jgi:hypothetical protein
MHDVTNVEAPKIQTKPIDANGVQKSTKPEWSHIEVSESARHHFKVTKML